MAHAQTKLFRALEQVDTALLRADRKNLPVLFRAGRSGSLAPESILTGLVIKHFTSFFSG